MARRSELELEKKDCILYKGDWARLDAILAPRKITVTKFIRELVHKKITQIEAAAQDHHTPLELPNVIDDSDIADLVNSSGHDEPADESRPKEPAGSI